MLFRAQVRTKALSLLQAAVTQGGAEVTSSKDTPIQSGQTLEKVVKVVVYTDDVKSGTGTAPPQFRTSVLTTVEMTVEGASKDDAEAMTDAVCETVENALLGDPQFVRLFEGIDSVETVCNYQGVNAKRHTFSAVMEIRAHVTEIFEPTIATALTGFNIWVDSIDPFDPAGTYEPPFDYPVAAPPRPSGPDGRIEISGSLDLPTE